ALSSRRAGALQASTRLALSLLLRISKLNKREIALAVRIRHHGHLDFWLDRLVGHDIKEIRLSLLCLDSPRYLRHILPAEIGVYGASCQLALPHPFNDGCRAQLAVPTSKHSRTRRHEIVGIGLDGLALGPLHSRLRRQHLQVGLLPIGRNYGIAAYDI